MSTRSTSGPAQPRRPPLDPTARSRSDQRPSAEEPLAISWFDPAGACLETVLSGELFRVGRDPENEIVLEGTEVSRNHAKISNSNGAVAISDQNSTNGILVDRSPERQAHAPLHEGTVLRVGEWIGVVTRGKAGPFQEQGPQLSGSARFGRSLAELQTVARSPLHIIVTGESGTGKELVARAVFEWSGLNHKGKFVALNCAALVESLLEEELFGHVRGAFTGAAGARVGHIMRANGGLLFLDEIGDMSALAQSKLLRVLQEEEVMPVGSSEPEKVRLRVIAATHRNLTQMVKAGTFRGDLMTRLEGYQLELLPLRERREDIIPLFFEFLRAALAGPLPTLTPELARALVLHDWPGNVRALKQCADRAAVLHASRSKWGLAEVDVPALAVGVPALPIEASDRMTPVMEQALPVGREHGRVAKERLTEVLRDSAGNVAQVVRILGVPRQSVYNHMRRYNVDPKQYRGPKPGS